MKSEIDHHQRRRNYELHNERCIRRSIARMDFAHPARHVRIEPCDKWNARGTAHPCRADSGDGDAQHQREWNSDPANSHALRHPAYGLHDALQNADIVLADRNQQNQCRGDVKHAGNNSAPGDGAGQSPRWVADFVAHN